MASEETFDLGKEWVKFKKMISQNRFKQLRGNKYVFDRIIFQVAMFLIFGWLLFVANWYHYDLDYYECVHGPGMAEYFPDGSHKNVFSSDMCKNPFYEPESWKNQEFLPPGKYGTQLGPMFESAWIVALLGLVGAFGLNHWIHNGASKKPKKRSKK